MPENFQVTIFFNDKFNGFDDGIYVALRLIEIIAKSNKKSSELLDGINKYYTTEELKIKVSDDSKFKIIEDLVNFAKENNLNLVTIDGCKIITEGGFVLIRASNTGPDLSFRVEDKEKGNLDVVKNYWAFKIEEIKNKYL